MRLLMGAFSSRVSRRAFSGPLLKHGRRLRPSSFSVNSTKGTEKKMKRLIIPIVAGVIMLTGCESIRVVIDSQTALGSEPSAEEAVGRLNNEDILQRVVLNGRNDKARVAAIKKCKDINLFKRLVCSNKESTLIRNVAFQQLVALGSVDRLISEDTDFANVIISGHGIAEVNVRGDRAYSEHEQMKMKHYMREQQSKSKPNIVFPKEYRIRAIETLRDIDMYSADNGMLSDVVFDENNPVDVRMSAIRKVKLQKEAFKRLLAKAGDNKDKNNADYQLLVKAYLDAADNVQEMCWLIRDNDVSFSSRRLMFSYLKDEKMIIDVLSRIMPEDDAFVKSPESDEVKFAKCVIRETSQEVLSKFVLTARSKFHHELFHVECVKNINDEKLLIKIAEMPTPTGGGQAVLSAAYKIKDVGKTILRDRAIAKYESDLRKRVDAIVRIYAVDPKDAYSIVQSHGRNEKDTTVSLINDEKTLIGLLKLNKSDKSYHSDTVAQHLKNAAYRIIKNRVDAIEKSKLNDCVLQIQNRSKELRRRGKVCLVDNYYIGMSLENFLILNKVQDVKAAAIDWNFDAEGKMFVIKEMAFDTKNLYKATGLEKSELLLGIPRKLGIAKFEVEMTKVKYNRNYFMEAMGSYDFNTVTGGEIYYKSENQAKGVSVIMMEKSGRLFISSLE